MKNKSLIFALAAFVVLGALYFQQQGQKKKSAPKLGLEKLLDKDIAPDSITKVRAFTAIDPAQGLELLKTDSGWVVANRFSAPAKAEEVARLLESVGKLEGEFRSDAPEILGDYGLTNETAIQVALYQGDRKETELLLGKEAGSFNECFMRVEGSNRVFKVSTPLRGQLGIHGDASSTLSDPKHWLDLAFIKFDRAKAKELEIAAKGQAITYLKKEKATDKAEEGKGAKAEEKKVEYAWEAEKKGKGSHRNSDEIAGLLGVLSHFNADDVLGRGGRKEYELDPSAYSVKIVMEDGQEFNLSIGKNIDETGRRYAAHDSSDLIYSITSYQFEKIFGKER